MGFRLCRRPGVSPGRPAQNRRTRWISGLGGGWTSKVNSRGGARYGGPGWTAATALPLLYSNGGFVGPIHVGCQGPRYAGPYEVEFYFYSFLS